MTTVRQAPGTRAAFDAAAVRARFPILSTTARGHPLVYLDNAATSQKPQGVIEAVTRYYETQNANVHRGVYELSERATAAYEAARERVRDFLGAGEAGEIVFVRGTTEAINLVASGVGAGLHAGDEILISAMEHHSNIVPWQLACERRGAVLRVIPMNRGGELLLDEYARLLGERTRLVAVTHVSNSLGTINPIEEIVELAHARGVPVLVDGAQAAPHLAIDVRRLGVDFYTVSGHKMFGPTGIGALYGRADRLAALPPYQGGGDMIKSVSFARTTYAAPPARFEAGTPNIAGAVGLAAAIDFLDSVDRAAARAHEDHLLAHTTARLQEIHGVSVVGTAARKAAVISFVVDGVHAHDVGTIVDREGVAIRTGHHCTQPVMEFFGVAATARASFALYNTLADADALVAAVRKVREVLA